MFNKKVYNSEYQFGGHGMLNDTTLIKFVLNYDASKKVTTVFKDKYESYSKKH